MTVESTTSATTAAKRPSTTSGGSKKRLQKPDEQAHKKVISEIEARIQKITAQLDTIKRPQNNDEKDEFSQKTQGLRNQFAELKTKRNALETTRSNYLEQIKSIQNGIKRKLEESRTSKDRIGFKSVQEIDQQIAKIEAEITSGTLKLIEEKKAVSEVSSLKKAKHQLLNIKDEQSTIEDDKKKLDQLRQQLTALDGERSAVRGETEKIKAQLDLLYGERSKSFENVNEINQQRKQIKEVLDAEYTKLKAERLEFRKANDEYYSALKEERARKQEEYLERKKQEQEEKIARLAGQELENANIPAYTEELKTISSLLQFFEQQYSVSSGEQTNSSDNKQETKFDIRKVDGAIPDGAVAIKKKDDREDDYMKLGNKSKKGGKKSSSNKPKQVRLDLEMMDKMSKLSISIPLSVEEIETSVKQLVAKKKELETNQAAKTEENKKKALEKIAAIRAAQAKGQPEEVATEEAVEA